MTHQNQGHYAKKHAGKEILVEEKLNEYLLKEAKEGTLACDRALLIANELGKSPQDIGIHLDLLEIRIAECQLGLFGFTPIKRTVKEAEIIDPAIQKLIENGVEGGYISCETLLKIAEQNNVSLMTLSGTCEVLKIKIKPCQLGAF
jgi:hypothetical protein